MADLPSGREALERAVDAAREADAKFWPDEARAAAARAQAWAAIAAELTMQRMQYPDGWIARSADG